MDQPTLFSAILLMVMGNQEKLGRSAKHYGILNGFISTINVRIEGDTYKILYNLENKTIIIEVFSDTGVRITGEYTSIFEAGYFDDGFEPEELGMFSNIDKAFL
jgi:hypothetical protein